MADCPSLYCADPWADLSTDLCPGKFNGGASTIYLLQCGVDKEDVTEDADAETLDATKINALIEEKKIVKVPGVRIGWGAPSAVTGDSFDPCNPEEVITYDTSWTVEDANVTKERLKFYNSINSAAGAISIAGALVVECDAQRITGAFRKLSLGGGRVLPTTNSERQRFEFTLTGRANGDDEIFDIPANLD
jgi:hypothetical protein